MAACILVAAAAALQSAGAARADITTAGQVSPTNTGNNDPWDVGGPLWVGWTEPGAVMIDGGSEVTSTYGYLGCDVGGEGEVYVYDSRSTWEITGDLAVGRIGDRGVGLLAIDGGASVYIGDAASGLPGLRVRDRDESGTQGGHLNIYSGAVTCEYAAIGGNDGESGWVTVNGPNALLYDDGSLCVGVWGGHGYLEIFDGGVSDQVGYVGGNWGHTTGEVFVLGFGSFWESTHYLQVDYGEVTCERGAVYVGDSARASGLTEALVVSRQDAGNETLGINEGGRVSVIDTYLGCGAGQYGDAAVRGYLSSPDLYVGYEGIGEMSISEGGVVEGLRGYLGFGPTGSGTVTVLHEGSYWELSSSLRLGDESAGGVGHLTVREHGSVYVGFSMPTRSAPGWVIISGKERTGPTGELYMYNGSTLMNEESAVIGDSPVLGDRQYGWATISGSGSTWTNGGDLFVGRRFGTGTLTIEAGGRVTGRDVRLGAADGGAGMATIDGSGSRLECAGDLSLGDPTADGVGHVTISNGGTVYVGDRATFCAAAAARLVVSDCNDGSGGHLGVYGGSMLANPQDALLAAMAGEYGAAIISGAGSTWNIGAGLTVADGGHGTLSVLSGGSVTSVSGTVAAGRGGAGEVVISGPSAWNIDTGLTVGEQGRGAMSVLSGGSVTSQSGTVAMYPATTGEVIVGDPGSAWNIAAGLTIAGGGDATMSVVSGGSVTCQSATVASAPGSTGELIVGGTGSTWTSATDLSVGYDSAGTLLVRNGGTVSDADGYLGRFAHAVGTATVYGAGAAWENTADLALGDSGGIGHLTMDNSGSVYVGNAARSGASAGRLTISDTDASGLGGGHLSLHNGSTLTNSGGAVLGDGPLECGWATIDGDGSQLAVSDLFIGNQGQGTLTVQNGGHVSSVGGYMAWSDAASGAALVTGANSLWRSSSSLDVCTYGGTAQVRIENGGTVETGTLRYGLGASLSLDGGTLKAARLAPAAGVPAGAFTWAAGTLELTGQQIDLDASQPDPVFGHQPTIAAGQTLRLSKAGVGLTIGQEGAGTAVVQNAGCLDVAGTAAIYPLGTLTVESGGTFRAATLELRGGVLNVARPADVAVGSVAFTSGLVTFTRSATLDDAFLDPFFGPRHAIEAGQQLSVQGTLTLRSDMVVDGGQLSPWQLVLENGAYLTARGQIPAAVLGSPTGSIFALGALELGSPSSYAGFHYEGSLHADVNTVTLRSLGPARLGVVTTLAGGSIVAPSGLALGPGSSLVGFGSVAARLAAETGSRIEATGDLAIGDATDPAGFFSKGELLVNEHYVTLEDANVAVLGARTVVGDSGLPGTLAAHNGLLVDFDASLTGFGRIETPNDERTPLVVNGYLIGNSADEPLTLTGYVKGVGTLGNVIIAGTLSPGLSPGEPPPAAQAVPEPSTVALLATAVLGLLALLLRRQR